ncbi:MAG: hypothetical protein JXR13_18745 [Thalassovita sp.]
MELKQFNIRHKAELGAAMRVCDPVSGKELIGDDGKHPVLIVRGMASKSAQRRIAELRRTAKQAEAKAAEASVSENDDGSPIEDLHEQLVSAAMDFVIRAENIEVDGAPVETSDQIRALLEMTFPQMGQARDESGALMFISDGETRVPQFEMKNHPFAKQVTDFAEDQGNFTKAG